uniref:Uracil phosphoribosyltransferase n=1 Tax=Osmundea sinicola TaxID=290685 RepID=A0A7L4WNY1_9FLOR|nr:uracil phosphoribosyltransferase [Osmundea sinicola]QFR99983.1 uracil phosphoribosyltransferase [Osmundea sinicola]
MKLNIYKISHPIIELISNNTIINHNNNNLEPYYYKNFGLLFMYEILRPYIKIETIYLKFIYLTKELKLLNKKQKYLIATNISNNYEIISEIKTLLPNIDILNISYNNNDNEEKINETSKNTKIFILEKKLNNIKIMNIIQYFTSTREIPIENIAIACVTSEHHILKQLGNICPSIKIYTTKILYNQL